MNPKPLVSVEFFAIPRERAGVSRIQLAASSVGELLDALAEALPEFADCCLVDGELRAEFLLSINGLHFTRDRSTPIREGDSVLILSADVGG